MDLSKLTDEQLQIALKVAEESKRQGVNPDFVLPMVMQESGFNPNAKSQKGAYGVMQLMDDTAKGLKIDHHDTDQNIRGGVTLIKQLMADPNIGNDPYKVLIGYNTSADTRNKYFKSGNLSDLPDETLAHINGVAGHYGGDLPSPVHNSNSSENQSESPAQTESVGDQSEQEDQDMGTGMRQRPGANKRTTMPLPMQSLAMGAAGAGAGALTGVAKYPIAWGYHKLADDVAAHEANKAQESGLTRTDKQILGTGDKSELTGRESQTGYNIKTAQEAARAKNQGEIAKSIGLNPTKVLAESADLASTPSGVLAPKTAIDQWKETLNHGIEMAGSTNPTLRERGKAILQRLGSVGSVLGKSFPAKLGEFGFGAGAAIPYSVELARNDHPLAAAGLPVATGLVASKFPKTFGGLTTMGALASTGYAMAHPRETAAGLDYSDVSPTAFMGMPEETTAPFPQYQSTGNAGRGYINPPLANR